MVHESLAENVNKLHFYSESGTVFNIYLCLKCYFSYLLGIFYAGFKGYIYSTTTTKYGKTLTLT